MPLTQDPETTIVERLRRDPDFAKALLDEAATLFLNGEPRTARLMLRDLIEAVVGFETLAANTGKPRSSLQRMLSAAGTPRVDGVAAISDVVPKTHGVDLC